MPPRIDAEELGVTFLRVAEAGGPTPRAIGRQRADAHARDPDAEALARREVARDHLEFAMPTAARRPAEGKARLPLRTRRDNGRVEWLLHGGRVHADPYHQSNVGKAEEFHTNPPPKVPGNPMAGGPHLAATPPTPVGPPPPGRPRRQPGSPPTPSARGTVGGGPAATERA